MHAQQLLYFRRFLYQLNKVAVCFDQIHISVCLWENGAENYIIILSLKLPNDDYDVSPLT